MQFTVARGHSVLVAPLLAAGVDPDMIRAGEPPLTQKPEVVPSVPSVGGCRPAAARRVPRATRLSGRATVHRAERKCGSWVAITIDPRGRHHCQRPGDCRPVSHYSLADRQQRADCGRAARRAASLPPRALLFAFGCLYLTFNAGPGLALRLRDTNGDDQFDEVDKLKDHCRHWRTWPYMPCDFRPTASESCIVAGNHTLPPIEIQIDSAATRLGGVRTAQRHATLSPGSRSRLAPNWDEDLLLPRQWDAWGRAVGLMAPNGWIAATDPDGREWEVLSVGFRNPYDMALNADGELFAYDADAEWEMGMPWYRTTYIAHATPGGEFGWRTSTGLWPSYRIDCPADRRRHGPRFSSRNRVRLRHHVSGQIPAGSLRPRLDVRHDPRRSSPRRRSQLHRHPRGILARSPLPVTDAAVAPDGALYFITGGRSTQSELFRVTYVGAESTAAVDARDTRFADLRPASKTRSRAGC